MLVAGPGHELTGVGVADVQPAPLALAALLVAAAQGLVTVDRLQWCLRCDAWLTPEYAATEPCPPLTWEERRALYGQ